MSQQRVLGVAVVHWNPRRNRLPYPLNVLPVGSRIGNFGDLIGPLIVRRLAENAGLRPPVRQEPRRLLSVGSILPLATDGDVIWGTGVNGKMPADSHRFSMLDVRAVRGPRTRAFLQTRGIDAPPVYGDPALLAPLLFPEWKVHDVAKKRHVGVVPNFHDIHRYRGHPGLISPLRQPRLVVNDILESEVIVASSLHGVILAESYGIPAVAMSSGVEHPLKYRDYFEGTGRADVPLLDSLADAVQVAANVTWPSAFDSWSQPALEKAFPLDLWGGASE